ncbi:MAG TPA: DUF3089 domain-containing protein [Capillimicrobium sp.]|nr:DUF3089 domain-containing protein [Capillimicrobium sp.]
MSTTFRRAVVVLGAALALTVPAASAPAAPTTWLCKPGIKANPCEPSLATTVFSPAGKRLRVERVRRAPRPAIDCFYVYPTVSDEPQPQADFAITPELRSIALYQAARYSQTCRVYAPVYRQVTLQGLFTPGSVTPEMQATALADVRAAWRDYLRRYNRGRGVVLIGHSQGSFVLRKLVAEEIDRRPAVRRRLVSALLLGGNVVVRKGADAGGDFRHVPACRSAVQLGCVIAFSTYDAPVPSGALFGRSTDPGLEVLCTNPASLRGGAGTVTPIMPTEPFGGTLIASQVRQIAALLPKVSTPWMSMPDGYRARCSDAGGANVLQVRPRKAAPDFPALPAATWGLHLTDANIALGDLTDIVARQAEAFTARH